MKHVLAVAALCILAFPILVFSSEIDVDFHAAVMGGSTDEVRVLLEAGADVNRKYANDYTALMCMAKLLRRASKR